MQRSRLHNSVLQAANKWIKYLKLNPAFGRVIGDMNLENLYRIWKDWGQGIHHPSIDIVDIGPGIHGRTRIRRGVAEKIEVSPRDAEDRQGLTLIHEILHAKTFPLPVSHSELHTMAAGLALHIFPQIAEKGDTLYLNDDELDALVQVTDGELYPYMDDDDDDDDEYDIGELMSDLDLRGGRSGYEMDLYRKGGFFGKLLEKIPIIGKKKRKKRRRQEQKAAIAARAMIPQVKSAGIEANVTRNNYKGWILPLITQLYNGQSYALPVYGVERMKPFHQIGGFKAPTWAAFWGQMIQSLDAGVARTAASADAATAVAGVATVVNLNTRSVGVLVQLTDSMQQGDQRPVRVRHFTQAGATELEYLVSVKPGSTAQWLVMAIENDRGAGIPTAANNHQVTINADGVRPGAILTIESINYREIER